LISFVVQNFYSTPFLPKTQRYSKLVVATNTQLLYLFIKDNVHYTSNQFNHINHSPVSVLLVNRLFSKPFFLFFKKINTKSFGIMTANLTKSLLYKTVVELDNLIVSGKPTKPSAPYVFSKYSGCYLQPIAVLSFAFQKKTYDTLMSYIIFLLVNNYVAPQNSFNLFYGFILCPYNFMLYPFVNLFYFKLRQF
jgi:hypothetical protein